MWRFLVFDEIRVKHLRCIYKKITSCSSTAIFKGNILRRVLMDIRQSSADNNLLR